MRLTVIIDTNVIYSGLNSKRGASYKLLEILPENKFDIAVSVPMVLEYESVLKRSIKHLSKAEIDDFIDYLCTISRHIEIFYLWRPALKDPTDDMVLELAITANAKYVITYNIKDFQIAEHYGIKPITPNDFLKKIGVIK